MQCTTQAPESEVQVEAEVQAPPAPEAPAVPPARVVVHRKAFIEALSLAAKVAPRKTFKEILRHVRFTFDGVNGSTLEATDLEIGLVVGVLGVKVGLPEPSDESGSVMLDPKRMLEVLRSSKDEEVELTIGADSIAFSGPTTKGTLPVEHDPSLFPCVPRYGEPPSSVELASADLRRLIGRTIDCRDDDSTRYALGGTLVEMCPGSPGGDAIAFVATDGKRLARQVVPVRFLGDRPAAARPAHKGRTKAKPTEEQPTTILPVKTLLILDALAGHRDFGKGWPSEIAVVEHEANKTKYRTFAARIGRAEVYSRLVEGRFPRYQDAYAGTDEAPCEVTVAPAALLAAVKQALPFRRDETCRGIILTARRNELAVRVEDVFSTTCPPAVVACPERTAFDVCLDGDWTAQALDVLVKSAVPSVSVRITDGANPVLFRTPDGSDTLIMVLTDSRCGKPREVDDLPEPEPSVEVAPVVVPPKAAKATARRPRREAPVPSSELPELPVKTGTIGKVIRAYTEHLVASGMADAASVVAGLHDRLMKCNYARA